MTKSFCVILLTLSQKGLYYNQTHEQLFIRAYKGEYNVKDICCVDIDDELFTTIRDDMPEDEVIYELADFFKVLETVHV